VDTKILVYTKIQRGFVVGKKRGAGLIQKEPGILRLYGAVIVKAEEVVVMIYLLG
jgi:hypothetical protein